MARRVAVGITVIQTVQGFALAVDCEPTGLLAARVEATFDFKSP